MSNPRGAGTWIAGVAAALVFAVGCGASPAGDPGATVEPAEQSVATTTTDYCAGSAPTCPIWSAQCITVRTMTESFKAWACIEKCSTPEPADSCGQGYQLACQMDGLMTVGGEQYPAYEWWCNQAGHDDPGGCSGCKPAF